MVHFLLRRPHTRAQSSSNWPTARQLQLPLRCNYNWLRARELSTVLETSELAILLGFLEALLRRGFLNRFFGRQDWDAAGAANKQRSVLPSRLRGWEPVIEGMPEVAKTLKITVSEVRLQ